MAEHISKQETKEFAETAAAAAATAQWPQTRAILRLIFIVLAAGAVIWALYKLQGVLVLLVLSIFFAYLVAPLVEFFRRPFSLRGRERAMPRVAAIAVVYVLLFGTLGLTVFLLLPQMGDQFTQLGRQAPGYYKGINERVQSLNRLFDRLPAPARDSVKETIGQTITALGEYIQAAAVETAAFALAHAPWLVLIPILAFFLLKDADDFRRSALKMLPRGRLRWRGDEFFQDVNSTLAAYIRAQLIACLLIGVICTVGFVVLDVPYALVLGIVAGVFEFIPLAGPLAVAVLAIMVCRLPLAGRGRRLRSSSSSSCASSTTTSSTRASSAPASTSTRSRSSRPSCAARSWPASPASSSPSRSSPSSPSPTATGWNTAGRTRASSPRSCNRPRRPSPPRPRAKARGQRPPRRRPRGRRPA